MYTLHVVSHTHWDREWYLPFQRFRFRLVQLVETLLEVLERDPAYRHFTLDGQAVILEDVAEVRPELAEPLRRHIRAGRLLVGPWFVLPDEFLVSPEALVRNLLLGRRICRAWGGGMKIGYVPDTFGHIGQLPQLLRGFGIGAAVFARGAGDAPALFRWAAPDGSEVLACYLRDHYDNLALLPEDGEGVARALAAARDSLAPHSASTHLLLMQGTDHLFPRPDLPQLLVEADGLLPDRVVHSSLPAYVAGVWEELGEEGLARLPLRTGEMRSPVRSPILPGVLSTRMWIKQRNHACQVLLERWAEPFAALAANTTGVHRDEEARGWGDAAIFSASPRPPTAVSSYLRLAWRYLLENHPHDSICGCSVDQVHREMAVRFDWCEQIGEEVARAALAALAMQVDTGEGELPALVVFNPSATPRTDRVVARVTPPVDPTEVVLLSPEGTPVPFRVHTGEEETLEIAFVARDVPPLGYATYRFAPSNRKGRKGRKDSFGSFAVSIENEFYRVQADPATGRLTVTDKETGWTLPGCHRLVDGGDRGDEYNYCPPERDLLIEAPAAPPTVRREADGVGQHLILQMSYRLPVGLDPADRSARSRETIEMPVTVRVTLTPGVRRVDFETTVENAARDHRLRVHFPVPLPQWRAWVEGHWDVVAWGTSPPPPPPPAAPPPPLPGGEGEGMRSPPDGWAEQPAPTRPQRGWVCVSDGRRGVTLANRGLPEVEIVRTETGPEVALTLLRCVGWLSRDDLPCRPGHAGPGLEVPEAQCAGRHTFRYALIPHTGDWRAGLAEAEAFQTDLRAVVTPAHPGPLPPALSFIRVEPEALRVSAVKPPEEGEGLVLRLWNAEGRPVEGRVRLWRPFAQVVRTDLGEIPMGAEISPVSTNDDKEITLTVRGREVVTLHFTF